MRRKVTLKKIEKIWTLIIEHSDGSTNEYRFATKKGAIDWTKLVA